MAAERRFNSFIELFEEMLAQHNNLEQRPLYIDDYQREILLLEDFYTDTIPEIDFESGKTRETPTLTYPYEAHFLAHCSAVAVYLSPQEFCYKFLPTDELISDSSSKTISAALRAVLAFGQIEKIDPLIDAWKLYDQEHKCMEFDIRSRDPETGGTFLHYASTGEIVDKLVVEYKADVNSVNFHGSVALHDAVSRDNPAVIAALLRHGANPIHESLELGNPLDYALARAQPQNVALLGIAAIQNSDVRTSFRYIYRHLVALVPNNSATAETKQNLQNALTVLLALDPYPRHLNSFGTTDQTAPWQEIWNNAQQNAERVKKCISGKRDIARVSCASRNANTACAGSSETPAFPGLPAETSSLILENFATQNDTIKFLADIIISARKALPQSTWVSRTAVSAKEEETKKMN